MYMCVYVCVCVCVLFFCRGARAKKNAFNYVRGIWLCEVRGPPPGV